MNKKKTNRTKKKWIIYSGILLSILIIVFFSANSIIGGLVREEVTKQLNSNPESLYHLKFEKLKVNIFTGNLTLKGLTVQPAEDLQTELSKEKIKDLIIADVKTFKIKNIKIFQFLRSSKIDISSIVIKDVLLDYYFKSGSKENSTDKTFAFEDIFSKNFQGTEISTIKISNTTLRFTNANDLDNPIFEIDSLNISVNDIILNKETLKHPMPISFSDIKINTGHFSLNSSEFYSIKTNEVHFNKQDSSIVINGFALVPKYNKHDFNKKIKYNNDWFSIKTQKIKLNKLYLSLLEQQNRLDVNSIQIIEPEILIYRDKRLPDAPFKYKPLLAGMVKKIPIDLLVDTLQIIEARLTYEEQVEISDEPGKVFFDPLYISVYNLTNNPEQIQIKPDMNLTFRGEIMGQALLNANFNIALNRSDEFFTVNGTLDPIAALEFNPFVKNALGVQINKGQVSKAEFNFKANDNESNGTLILDYEELKVEVFKTKDQTKKSGFMSFVANEVIRSHNLDSYKKYIVGNIGFERRKDKAIVNFVWNSCKTGIISIVAPIADKNKKKEKQAVKEEKKENRKNHNKNHQQK